MEQTEFKTNKSTEEILAIAEAVGQRTEHIIHIRRPNAFHISSLKYGSTRNQHEFVRSRSTIHQDITGTTVITKISVNHFDLVMVGMAAVGLGVYMFYKSDYLIGSIGLAVVALYPYIRINMVATKKQEVKEVMNNIEEACQ